MKIEINSCDKGFNQVQSSTHLKYFLTDKFSGVQLFWKVLETS